MANLLLFWYTSGLRLYCSSMLILFLKQYLLYTVHTYKYMNIENGYQGIKCCKKIKEIYILEKHACIFYRIIYICTCNCYIVLEEQRYYAFQWVFGCCGDNWKHHRFWLLNQAITKGCFEVMNFCTLFLKIYNINEVKIE